MVHDERGMDRLALRRAIDHHFSESELRDLCFELGVDYEHLDGANKGDKVRALVLYAERHNCLDELAAAVIRLRPATGDALSALPATLEPKRTVSPSGRSTPQRRAQAAVAAAVLLLALGVLVLWRLRAQGERATATHSDSSTTSFSDMLFIEAGLFEMGSDEGAADHQPARMVYLDDYWIDTYEVTNDAYQQFIDATNHRAPDHWIDGDYADGLGDHPVLGVTWHDARQYCEWSGGRRLPTEAEWEKAARGTDGRRWPWGNTAQAGQANTFEAGRGNTAPVGAFADDISPYGVMDMAGNAQEWVNDWYQADYYAVAISDNPPGPAASETRVIRGGAYWLGLESATTYSRLGIYRPEDPPATNEELSGPSLAVGFRCACTSCG